MRDWTGTIPPEPAPASCGAGPKPLGRPTQPLPPPKGTVSLDGCTPKGAAIFIIVWIIPGVQLPGCVACVCMCVCACVRVCMCGRAHVSRVCMCCVYVYVLSACVRAGARASDERVRVHACALVCVRRRLPSISSPGSALSQSHSKPRKNWYCLALASAFGSSLARVRRRGVHSESFSVHVCVRVYACVYTH
jgi:hypothetical protein